MAALEERWARLPAEWVPGDFTADLLSDLVAAIGILRGQLQTKLGFIDELPWKLWRCRDRECMAACLQEYDQAVAAGLPMHRVADYFFGGASGGLRSHVETFLDTGELPLALSEELRGYEGAPLSEAPAEGGHRDISMVRRRATASGITWHGSSVRMSQNIASYKEAIQQGEVELFHRYFETAKSLMQTGPKLSRCARRRKVRTDTFLAWLYRFGPDSMLEWPSVQRTLVVRAGNRTRAPPLVDQLARDWFAIVLRSGSFYSVETSGAAGDEVSTGAANPLAAAGSEVGAVRPSVTPGGGSAGLQIFAVLDSRPQMKKVVHAITFRDAMVPVQVQRFTVHVAGTAAGASSGAQPAQRQQGSPSAGVAAPGQRQVADAGELAVEMVGKPEYVDACSLASLPQCRKTMQEWTQVVPGRAPRTFTARRPARVAARSWGTVGGTPAYMLMYQLQRIGWRYDGRWRQGHTALTPKRYRLPSAQHKYFLTCLAGLERLCEKGLAVLPVGECDMFYRAVWTAGEPAQVPRGLPARAYRPWLAGSEAEDLEAMGQDESGMAEGFEDREASVDIQDRQGEPPSVVDSDDMQVCVTLCAASLPRGRALAVRPQASAPVSPAGHLREAGEGASAGGGSLRSGEGSTSSKSSDPAEPVVASAPRPDHFVSYRAVLPDRVEGQVLTEQRWEGDKPFHRLRVLCALHPGCGKARNFGSLQTAAHGPLEVAGYLGAWLKRAGSFPSKRDHQSHRPTAGDVTAYLAAQPWAAGARARPGASSVYHSCRPGVLVWVRSATRASALWSDSRAPARLLRHFTRGSAPWSKACQY